MSNYELEEVFDNDNEESTTVSMETHIPASNIGYKLLQKMGWQVGKGLGSQGQGRIDPIRIELKDDSLGVGKADEYLATHISSTSKRKATEIEKQLDETEIQKIEREHHVVKKQAIAQEISQVTRAFYCELCDKQYRKVSEYEQHLQSYDHHHRKRFKDMKEAAKNSTLNQTEKEKKLARERKREEKELKRMQEALQKKMGHTTTVKATRNDPASIVSSNSSGGGGGWSQVNTPEPVNNNNSGGWSQVETTSNTGWSQVEPKSNDGWSQVETSNNYKEKDDSWSQIKISEPTKPQIPAAEPKSNSQPKPPTNEAKKLSFGLKKTSFSFGLKKK